MPLWRRLGVAERFEKAGFVRKYGAYFCFADGERPEYSHFPNASRWIADHSYEVRRADFDQILWDAALETGIDARDETEVEEVIFAGARATGVVLRAADGSRTRVRARLVADCSGRATLSARSSRCACAIPSCTASRSTATTATRSARPARTPARSRCRGAVRLDVADPRSPTAARRWARVLDREWYGARRASAPTTTRSGARYSRSCPAVARRLRGRPQDAGRRGDRRLPVPPARARGRRLGGNRRRGRIPRSVFSSGVHLAMTGAERASARGGTRALAAGRLPVARDFARYARESRAQLGVYARFIYAWYDPAFREVFMRPPHGRPGVAWLQREVVSVLAGSVTPTWRVCGPRSGRCSGLARRQRRRETRAAREEPGERSQPLRSPCAVIPTYDNPATVRAVVETVRAHLADIVVVDDGSGAAGRAACDAIAQLRPRARRAARRKRRQGRGGEDRLRGGAAARGHHVLQVDADGQHDLGDVPRFLAEARAHPDALILGRPVFDATQPRSRAFARQLSIFWVSVETGSRAIADPQCGFRVYPLARRSPRTRARRPHGVRSGAAGAHGLGGDPGAQPAHARALPLGGRGRCIALPGGAGHRADLVAAHPALAHGGWPRPRLEVGAGRFPSTVR
jgi:hypothetical protein